MPELEAVSGALSQDGDRVDLGEQVAELPADNRNRFPATVTAVESEYPNEPYRQRLTLMRERLDRVTSQRSGGYEETEAFRQDLDVLAADLRANGAGTIARNHVEPLIRKVETFGFTLASLVLRDH